ncbi:MAG: class I SAM-dependent methyltransferase [Cyclobacteriaceae bacterium]
MSGNVAGFYNNFAADQAETGVNERHFSIEKWLLEFGLNETSKVLEIGCGIGTVTELILKHVRKGDVLAVDISPKSINFAMNRLSRFDNLNLVSGDILELKLGGKYDFIVLPDVLEHIPINQHDSLFQKLAQCLEQTGTLLIHIPNPYYLEWVHQNEPEKLQVIDQPIYSDILLSKVYKHNLYLHFLKTYSIWIDNCDYQIICLKLKNQTDYRPITPVKVSYLQRALGWLKKLT